MVKRIEAWILAVIFGQFLVLFVLFSLNSANQHGDLSEKAKSLLSGDQIDVPSRSVVFLKISDGRTDIWKIDITGQNLIQLSHNGNVYDFTVSRDGGRIIYSAFNVETGVDIWEIDNIAQIEQKLVSCEKNWCTQVALSPDNRYIAYSHKPGGESLMESEIFIYDYQEKTTFPLIVLNSIKSTAPAWSLNGDRLSYFDPVNNLIHVIDFLGDQGDLLINTTFQYPVYWSKIRANFYWVEPRATVQGVVYSFVYVTDIETGQQTQVLGLHEQAEFSIPEESPDGQWIVYNVRFPDGGSYRYLYIKNLVTGIEEATVQDLKYYYGGYHWDTSSKMLVLQRIKTNDSQAKPEVIIWRMETNSMTLLVENASRPQWLP